jgi:hypothetical protein
LELSAPGALINTEIQAKARRRGATLTQVGVHHYPRVAGEATGGSPRVILRAMRETIVLWWRMRSYRPTGFDGKAPRRRRLGDSGVAAFSGLAVAALVAVIRRVAGRR